MTLADGVANDGDAGEADNPSAIEKVVGGRGDDRLAGNGAANILEDGAGDDVLVGLDGDDLLRGGDRADQLNGNIGSDTLDGGFGPDELFGGTRASWGAASRCGAPARASGPHRLRPTLTG